MNDIQIIVFICIAFLALLYLFNRYRRAFVIKIKYRYVDLVSGSAPPKFISECKEVAESQGLIKGKIIGIKQNGGIKLKFSKSISESQQQIFKNVFPNAYMVGNTPPSSGGGKRAAK